MQAGVSCEPQAYVIGFFGDPDNSREGVPGSEKYRENSKSKDLLHRCREAEVAGTGSDQLSVRQQPDPAAGVVTRVGGGAPLAVTAFKADGPVMHHDAEPGRRSALWYQVTVPDGIGWVTAVFTRCLSQ